MAAPEVTALARELAGRTIVLKVDTEADPVIAQRLGIQVDSFGLNLTNCDTKSPLHGIGAGIKGFEQ